MTLLYICLNAKHNNERFPLAKKKSGNSSWDVNGLFGLFHWKFSGINRISEKVVPFSRWKLPIGSVPFTDFSSLSPVPRLLQSFKQPGLPPLPHVSTIMVADQDLDAF